MNTSKRFFFAILGMAVPVLLTQPTCLAQCGAGSHPRLTPSRFLYQPGQVRLLPAAFLQEEEAAGAGPSIVGFWHQQLIVSGAGGATQVIDDDLAHWHSDGTEIQNTSSRAPSTSDVCLGIWEKTGQRSYRLNPFPLVWDATGSTFIGPANLREEITLTRDGTRYRGTFTIYQYDPSGNKLPGGAEGVVTGTRITPDSTPENIFGPKK